MNHPTPKDIEAALAAHEPLVMPALPGRRNHLETGVLVPLQFRPEPVCIVTLRSPALKHHAGEVCFPGGRPEPDDADLAQTALREAREELGIERARVLGSLSSIPLLTSDFRLFPFVAAVDDRELVVNQREVEQVLHVPLRDVLEQSHIDAVAWSIGEMSGLSPVFQLDGPLMYGATAHSFYELLVVTAPLFDLELPALQTGRFDWQEVLTRADRQSS